MVRRYNPPSWAKRATEGQLRFCSKWGSKRTRRICKKTLARKR